MNDRRMARAGGWAAVAAGLTGALGSVFLLAIPPMVPPDVFNYPLSHGMFTIVQILFGVHHLLTAFALWAFWRAGLAGSGRLASAAGWSAFVSMALLGLWEFVAITGAGAPYPSDQTAWIETGYGALSMVSGVALVLLGVAAMRARVLRGGWRWIVLIIGGYVFVALTPALMLGFVLGRIAIGVWLLMFAVLGWGMLRWAVGAAPQRQAAPTSARDVVS